MMWQPRADHEQRQELGDVTITQGLDATRPITEALQLRFSFDVSVSCDGLVSAAPHRPGDDVSRADAALGQAHRHTPDLLNRPADQSAAWQALVFVCGGGHWLARRRTAAIRAKASITRETCRCHSRATSESRCEQVQAPSYTKSH